MTHNASIDEIRQVVDVKKEKAMKSLKRILSTEVMSAEEIRKERLSNLEIYPLKFHSEEC